MRSKVVILATEHLFAHTGTDLHLKIEDSTETEVMTFTALIIFRVLDATATAKCIHSGVDILVQMQTLLRLLDTAARVHVDTVKEIRVTVVQLATDPSERPHSESTERLFLTRSQITEDTNVLGEDVLASTDDRNRGTLELLVTPLCVRTLRRD